MATPFVHLHAHSHFTLLESTIPVKGLVKAAKEAGMPAVALTDRGSLLGACEFVSAAKDAGITGIIGCQVNIAPLGMRERSQDMLQLVLLAMDHRGYRNLSKLVSRGWLEGYYYEPRVDLEAIAAAADGLICLTGAGDDGFLNRHLRIGAVDEAARQAQLLHSIFGDRLYMEITEHGHEGPLATRGPLLELSQRLGIAPVASNWVHYLGAGDHEVHDVQLAVQKATSLKDPRRKRMPSPEFWFKSGEAMAALFASCPEAVANTLVIAERCKGSGIPKDGYHLPTFACPNGLSEMAHLRQLCELGLAQRYGTAIDSTHRERLAFELDTIERMGFAAYFLIVADFINWAKQNGIPVGPGRGSAAGSLVAYVMGITDLCPLRYGLLFERFLNPGRKSMPDIDVDFCKDGRQRVIEYVSAKYGSDAVTQIMTLGTMKARMAIKDVARAHDWTPEDAQELANLVPEDPSGKHTIPVCLGLKPLDKDTNTFDASEPMKARYGNDTRTRELLDHAMRLENLGRSLGVHACGIIIAPGPVSDYVPVCKVKDKPATQYNMSQVEECGLLKMDFLGLKTMSILKKAADIVVAGGGPLIDFTTVPTDDRATFQLLGEGRTLGVFQCESSGFQELIRRLQPDRFEDMIALVALYRPGPLMAGMHISYCERKHGREKVEYPHPVLEDVLKETYGLYIYQEQVMNISRELCGFTPAEADDLRKAMGKKKRDVLEKIQEKFVNGAWERHQYDKAKCAAMWENILGFASYCFNKSHSACYGLIAYWTAYMKANHFAAFMTANLIYEMGNKEKMTQFIAELRDRGVPVLPPSVNSSVWEFSYDGNAVRFGFGGVKGIGEAAAEALIAERSAHGPFRSLYDCCERIDTRKINKRVIEHLIRVGAYDEVHTNRRALHEAIDRAFDRGARLAKSRKESQTSLFAVFEESDAFRSETQGYPDVPDWTESERLAHEKQLTGHWISNHPVAIHLDSLRAYATQVATGLASRPDGEVTIAAVVTGKRVIRTKAGKMMAVLQLEDLTGRFEAILFAGRTNRRGQYEPGPYDRFAEACDDDLVALFTGTIDERRRGAPPPAATAAVAVDGEDGEPAAAGDEDNHDAAEALPSLIVKDVVPAAQLSERLTREVILRIDASRHGERELQATESLLRDANGTCPVAAEVWTPGGVLVRLALSDAWRIHPRQEHLESLRRIWGSAHVQTRSLETAKKPVYDEAIEELD
jgi:DNA polymerase-3 subunit alpha